MKVSFTIAMFRKSLYLPWLGSWACVQAGEFKNEDMFNYPTSSLFPFHQKRLRKKKKSTFTPYIFICFRIFSTKVRIYVLNFPL